LDPNIRETIKKSLIGAIGGNKVLFSDSDLQVYRSESFSRLMSEKEKGRSSPDFAVLPETAADVQEIVKIASEFEIPLIPKGGGSNLVGMLVPVIGGIIIDTIKMKKIIEISVPNLSVTVQPGITLKELDEELSKHGLALNQLQGSYKVATIGGSISTSGFPRKHNKYGAISDRVMSLEVVLADGGILRTGPKVLYTSTGYRLHQLFIGAEGTLGVITEATLRVEPLPEAQAIVMAFYDDFAKSLEVATRVKTSGVMNIGLEAFEIPKVWDYKVPAGKRGVVIVDFEGTRGEVEAEKEFVTKILLETGGVLSDPKDAEAYAVGYEMIWCGLRAMTEQRRDYLCSFIPTERLMEFYDKIWNDIMPRYGITNTPSGERCGLDVGRYEMAYGTFMLPDDEKWHENYRSATKEIAELTVSLSGSIAACMGVGMKYNNYMSMEYSETALDTMRGIKKVLDPKNIMNPMKKLPELELYPH
jgi:FAD/FMN-containing dehydrogenase